MGTGRDDLIIVKPLITKLLQGQHNAGFIINGIYPQVLVPSEKGEFPIMGDDEFNLYEVHRAMDSESAQLDIGLDSDDFTTEELSLEAPIDRRKKKLNQLSIDLETLFSGHCKLGINLVREKDGADRLQNETNYAASNQKVLDGTAGKYYWSDTTNGTPIEDINAAIDVVSAENPAAPRVAWLGEITLWTLRDHPVIRRKINGYETHADPITSANVINWLKSEFGFSEILIGLARYKNSAGVKTRLWSDNFGIVRRVIPTGKIDSAFGYELVEEGSTFVYGYKKEAKKSEVVGYQTIQTLKEMNWNAGYLIKNTNETL